MSRIVMLAHSYFPQNPRTRAQAVACVEAGHEVEMICLREPGQAARERCRGVDVRRLGVARRRSSGKLGYLLEYARFFVLSALALTRSDPADLIVVHNIPEELVFATLPAKLRGTPVVLDIHDPLPELFADKYGLEESSRVKRFLRRLELASCRFADHVLVAADPFKERYVRMGLPPDSMTVILNSPLPEEERIPVRPFVMMYMGSVFDRYGLDVVLRGTAIALQDIPELELDLFTSDVDEACLDSLRSLAEDLGIASRVTFNGYLAPLAVQRVLQTADVALCPLRRSCHIDLTYPTKLLHCLADGIPVLCARTPALASLFPDDCVAFYEPEEPEDFAAQVRLIAASSAEWRTPHARAGRLSEELSWAEMDRRLAAVVSRFAPPRDIPEVREPAVTLRQQVR